MSTFNSSETRQLRQLFENSADKYPNNIALICDKHVLSYQELECRANHLANYLISQGVSEKDCVAIFLARSVECYISILAVLKTGAAYVPIEVEHPDDRVNYILADLPFHSVITTSSQFERKAIQFPNAILLDLLSNDSAEQSNKRPLLTNTANDQLCYVIYTSGSTGKPKGVEVTHHNICHYVSVASNLYEITPNDRIYQGFSLAFDASMEEFWMAFANGATLVACTIKDIRSGVGLTDFLAEHKVSVFSTVPTLLSTLESSLPNLRLLILGGEACTANLIKRFSRAGLRIMNTYGPTEATVIATYAECYIDKPVTIGKALPGYEVLILDENLQVLPNGQQGELCIAGNGIARGYVNRPDITAAKFIKHPNDERQRLYRTGDLALINALGDIEFLGRIDDQVKLRGFRIELNEIETVIMEFDTISQAVVSLQELDTPTLVAYLIVVQNKDFDLQKFKVFLQARLPHYMIPALFERIDAFPLLPSGKVNRKALPKPTHVFQHENYVAPKTKFEQKIAEIWEEGLQHRPISAEADFFYDLGGHSLSAAKIVSNLRKISGMHEISILDLYRCPTVKKLAEKFDQLEAHNTTHNIVEEEPGKEERGDEKKRNKTNTLSYFLCGTGQFFGCLFQYAIGAWQLLAVILCYAWVNKHTNTFSKEYLLIFLLLFLAMPIASLAITISAKWLLLGRIKPGVHKLWSWYYFRFWLVHRLQVNIFPPKNFIGTPLINFYYRLLGAKIGKNCYIGSVNVAVHDLLTIGANSSIGYDSRLFGYVVEDGWLKIGKITIGEQCFIGSRSVVSINTVIHDKSILDDMSLLPNNGIIPANQFFCGSPACESTPSPDHITQQNKTIDNSSALKNFSFGILHYCCLIFSMIMYYICYYPALLLITHFHEKTHYLLTVLLAAPIGAIIFLSLHFLFLGTCKKLLMNKIKPGTYSIKSLYYIRQWTIVKMLDIDEVSVLADTLYFPYFMRFLGAKLGKRVEMGNTPHVIPDLITIQDEGFTASSVALAWPTVYNGLIKFAPIHIGERAFMGNMSLLTLGAHVGDGGLIGCLTITPPNNQAAGAYTSWLGSPAIFLPKREIAAGYSDKEKFIPPKHLFNTRLAIEFARIIMPTTFTLIGLFNMLYVLNILFAKTSLLTTFLVLPIAELLIVCALVGIVVLLKWLLIGKLKPSRTPLWHLFIWKYDIVEYSYSYFVNPYFTNLVLGTPFAPMLLRALGAKVGKKVFIDTVAFAEFDLTTLGDEVCINADTIICTHLFEDRVFKTSHIDIHEGCNVGIGSMVLYDTVMEKNSTLGNLSLLMKGETLPMNSSWQGIPAQPLHVHYKQHQKAELINMAANPLVLEAS